MNTKMHEKLMRSLEDKSDLLAHQHQALMLLEAVWDEVGSDSNALSEALMFKLKAYFGLDARE